MLVIYVVSITVWCQVFYQPWERGKRHDITLFLSITADLRPLGLPLFSAIDVFEDVVALELAWETLLEGAILQDADGCMNMVTTAVTGALASYFDALTTDFQRCMFL